MKVRCLSLVGMAMLVAGIFSAPAMAQNSPDGSAGPQQRAPRARVAFDCSYSYDTSIVMQDAARRTTSTTFAQLPGASVTMDVDASKSSGLCVIVTFTAETACSQTNAGDFCYIQALDNGVPMEPNGQGAQAADSESSTASAHTFRWATFVDFSDFGEHTFTIEWRVRNAPTRFQVDDWVLTVEVLEESFSTF